MSAGIEDLVESFHREMASIFCVPLKYLTGPQTASHEDLEAWAGFARRLAVRATYKKPSRGFARHIRRIKQENRK